MIELGLACESVTARFSKSAAGSFRLLRLLSWVLPALATTVMLDGVASAADVASAYPLQLISPRAGMSVANRLSKAYPGLIYDVDVAAVGGTYPYTFTLTTAPSGMTIDSNVGRITWPSPAAQSAAYPVAVTVRDSAGATVSVSWSVTVTTSGFKFIDANNGKTVAQGGAGSISNPWKSIEDWYVSKYDTSNAGNFLYYRAGTYHTSDAPLEDGIRMACPQGGKPVVWLAYPGEKPVIDTSGSYISMDTANNLYFDGLTIANFTAQFGVRMGSSASQVVFRRNTLSNLPVGSGGVGTNAAEIMVDNDMIKGAYWAFLNNTFTGVHDAAYGLLAYSTDHVLVQSNTINNFTNSENKGIGPKLNNTMWFIRDNRINISAGQGIWVDTYTGTSDIEVSYNLVQASGAGTYALWVGQELATYGPFTSFRNTYDGALVDVDNLAQGSGPVSFNSDVIVTGSTANNGLVTNSSPSSLSLVKISDLLVGTASSGIVDSSGNLAGTYTQYVGLRGYQRVGGTSGGGTTAPTVPNPPTSLTVR